MAEELNATQIKLVCAVLTNLEAPLKARSLFHHSATQGSRANTLKVNWEAVNAITEHANANSARRQWDNLRAKKGWGGGVAGKGKDGDAEGASKPKAARKRKNNGRGQNGTEDDADDVESPSAAKKARKSAKDEMNVVKPEPEEA